MIRRLLGRFSPAAAFGTLADPPVVEQPVPGPVPEAAKPRCICLYLRRLDCPEHGYLKPGAGLPAVRATVPGGRRLRGKLARACGCEMDVIVFGHTSCSRRPVKPPRVP